MRSAWDKIGGHQNELTTVILLEYSVNLAQTAMTSSTEWRQKAGKKLQFSTQFSRNLGKRD
jgi:HKD family nuclease